MSSPCPYICNNKTEYGYCKTSACINKDGWYLSYGEVIKTTPLVSVPTADAEPYIEFCEWVADTVLYEDFEDKWTLGAFAEVACRKLHKLGFVRKDGEYWTKDESTMGQLNPNEPINYHIENDGTYEVGE